MAKYAFPAVFTLAEEGGYTVNFPDVPNCFTDGDTLAEAIEMANDVLCLRLYDIEESGESVPVPSPPDSIHKEENEFVSMVACDSLEYRKFFDKKAVFSVFMI